jgi:hypothetical protein
VGERPPDRSQAGRRLWQVASALQRAANLDVWQVPAGSLGRGRKRRSVTQSLIHGRRHRHSILSDVHSEMLPGTLWLCASYTQAGRRPHSLYMRV